MSLLIKALNRAEQKNQNSQSGDLTLEPMENPRNGARQYDNAVQAAGNLFAAASAGKPGVLRTWLDPRNWSLVPATLLFATLFSCGYGYYIYLMTRPPAGVSTAAAPAATMPAPARQAAAIPALPDTRSAKPDTANADSASSKPSLEAATLESGSVPAASTAKPRQVTTAAALPEPSIAVAGTPPSPLPDPLAASAYRALQEGNLEEARMLYQRLANSEPRNVDALLGLASIGAQQQRSDQAGKFYLQALEAEPKNAAAQAGLIALIGSADPLAAESRLKQLIAAQPSAFLYFTLGNLYAEQAKWPAAEQAYFQAQQLEPENADYAYNLAVSLEHLNQPAIALTYYRRAQQFASRSGGVHFDSAALSKRIAQLVSRREGQP